MDVQDLLENILKKSKDLGTFSLTEALAFAANGHLNVIAVAKEGKSSVLPRILER